MAHYYHDANGNRDNYHTHGVVEPRNGGAGEKTAHVPRYNGYPVMHSPPRKDPYKGHRVKGNLLLQPWSSTVDRPKNGDKSPPRFNRKGLSRSNVHRDSSLPLRDHYRDYNYDSASDDEDVDEDDDVCENGFCVRKPKDEDYDKNKHKESGHAPGNYTVTDSYRHDKSYADLHNKTRGKGTTQPRTDRTSNNRPGVNNTLPLIKTEGDNLSKGAERDSPVSIGAQRSPFTSSPVPVGAQRSPFGGSSPRKDLRAMKKPSAARRRVSDMAGCPGVNHRPRRSTKGQLTA